MTKKKGPRKARPKFREEKPEGLAIHGKAVNRTVVISGEISRKG
jgi:hypothetical protein